MMLVNVGLAVSAVVLLPALVLALVVEQVAVRLGWEPGRLRNFAVASLVVPAVSMVVEGSPAGPLLAAWRAGHELVDGALGRAVVDGAVLYLPVGMLLALGWWATYRHRAKAGKARTLAAGERHKQAHQKRQQRTVARRARGEYPLTTPDRQNLVVGPLLSVESGGVERGAFAELIALHPEVLHVPFDAVKKHLVLVGDTGAGKTTFLQRFSASVLAAAWAEYHAGTAGRPLVIFADCKGGPKGAEDGAAWADQMIAAGLHPSRVGRWPDEDRLDVWGLPASDLHELLDGLIAASNEYYDELRELVLHLIVAAPVGTPRSSAEFLSRFSGTWLRKAWTGHLNELAQIDNLTGGRDEALASTAMRYTNLFRKLGRMLDAGRDLADFDALYCVVDGVRRPKEAQAQAACLLRMVTELLTRHEHGREVYLVVDEYSAVAGGGTMTSLVGLAERLRSLGGHLLASAQTWEGLGPDDDQRKRLVGTCAGGRLLMRSPAPERLAEMSGTRLRPEPSRHISTDQQMGEGSERLQDTWLIDPNRIRQMGRGDIVYAVQQQAHWGHVVPLARPGKQLGRVVREALPPSPSWDRVPLAQLEADVAGAMKALSTSASSNLDRKDGGVWS